jgi:hypothetical protein
VTSRLESRSWRSLGNVAPSALTEARLQLHWAAQLVAAVGKTHISPRPDDSHPNMEWWDGMGALVGNPSETTPVFRAALRPSAFFLLLLDGNGDVVDEFALEGHTMSEGFVWLESAIMRLSAGRVDRSLDRTLYDIPAHRVAGGAPFGVPTRELVEMSAWFANGDLAMRRFVGSIPNVTAVRCWPHHFDVGVLHFVDAPTDSVGNRSVGMGMTPGDDYYAEPYWYVNPFPPPEGPDPLPTLGGGGQWHQGDWFGAVLLGRDAIRGSSARDQERQVATFLQSAFEAARVIAGA